MPGRRLPRRADRAAGAGDPRHGEVRSAGNGDGAEIEDRHGAKAKLRLPVPEAGELTISGRGLKPVKQAASGP